MNRSPAARADAPRPGRHGPVSWRRPWQIVETRFNPAYRAYAESVFSQANGYLGIRGDFEEAAAPGAGLPLAVVAGVYDHPPRLSDELVSLPLWYRIDTRLGGRRLHARGRRLVGYCRALSLRDAVLTRTLSVEDREGRRTRMRFTRFLSAANRHLAVQRVAATPLNWSGPIALHPYLDATAENRDGGLYQVVAVRAPGPGDASLEARTVRSRVRVAMASCCRTSGDVRWRAALSESGPGAHCRTTASGGDTWTLTRYTAAMTSRESRSRDLMGDAAAVAAAACAEGYRRAIARHRAVWRERWQRADVVIDGDPVRSNALRFCLCHLMQAAPSEDDRIAIGAKALTSEWYRGHFFWDTELFMLPFFVHAAPPIARNLVSYRWRTLPGARANARANGYRGAMFPWEAALDGREQTPTWISPPEGGPRVRVWTGEREHHITADVAFGAWYYATASGDEAFRTGPGAQILVEAARFWESRARRSAAGDHYDIADVIGPDEFHEKVDNNAFTNALAAWTLRAAADAADELLLRGADPPASTGRALPPLNLDPGEPRRWRRVASALYQPACRGGVIEQHQGFFGLASVSPELLAGEGSLTDDLSLDRINASQILKQADVLMLLALLPERRDPEVVGRNWDYYEPRTVHASSLSPSIHAVVAADLGRFEKALHYFDWACHLDLADRQGNTWQGLHAAALGGAWLAAVRGFGGLRLTQDGLLSVAPRTPPEWRGLRFSAAYRGGRLLVRAEPLRTRLCYEHPGGSPADLVVFGRRTRLRAHSWKWFAAPPPRS